jgi:hypothetical protein
LTALRLAAAATLPLSTPALDDAAAKLTFLVRRRLIGESSLLLSLVSSLLLTLVFRRDRVTIDVLLSFVSLPLLSSSSFTDDCLLVLLGLAVLVPKLFLVLVTDDAAVGRGLNGVDELRLRLRLRLDVAEDDV